MPDPKEVTLHRRILAEIEQNIVSGTWPAGHRIPFEVELARHYGCSRMTVNKVLTQLAKAGLIERRRRSGSFVRQASVQSAVLEIHDIRKEVEQLGLAHAFKVIRQARRKLRDADLRRIDLPAGAPVLEVTGVHTAGGTPFCVEERLISLDAVPDAATAEFGATTPGQWLLERVPWTTAEHRIEAAPADRTTATRLDIPSGAACLVIERRTWTGPTPVTHVRLTYPGDRHALVARFTPAS